ncbi:ZZ-type zinc finger-containing protein 3-like isoform X2 [Oncorhynchus masou masou]|uniref:ZZ-type zinc finger-containing protein 3-like isoform X2 n=1 Tax=Oncorhynchus masou masou TaxID=90313 RepID=UPI00318389D3
MEEEDERAAYYSSLQDPDGDDTCDVCGVEPIQGVRWHCQDCPSDNAVDFCSNCSDCLYKTESHLPSHHLEPVHHHETFLDRDYCLAQTPGYNYLDPNYYPANR